MKQKSAFSLIEVLLVTAIIAVVTAMGFSISKSGMEKAYNLYWYTGYSTLNDVTYDALHKQKISLDESFTSDEYDKYINHLERMIIHPSSDFREVSDDATTLTAVNGIKYTIYKQGTDANGNPENFIKINMAVPHAQKENAKTNTDFILPLNDSFSDNIGHQILVYPAKKLATSDAGYMDLQDRADLLPFYKKPVSSSEHGVKDFKSFKAAFCEMNGNTYGLDTDAEINCRTGGSSQRGTLKHISPRKAY